MEGSHAIGAPSGSRLGRSVHRAPPINIGSNHLQDFASGANPDRTGDLLLAVAAGVLFGVSDIALKYLTGALHGGVQGIVSEWTLTALAASVLAFYASARGLQLAPGLAVIAFTSVAANLAAILGGILVFRDPIGIGVPAIVGRVMAFGLVIAGAAFMPAPVRAGRAPGGCNRPGHFAAPSRRRLLMLLLSRDEASNARAILDATTANAEGAEPSGRRTADHRTRRLRLSAERRGAQTCVPDQWSTIRRGYIFT
jgi:hypothetical protein